MIANGQVEKLKARLVARGSNKEEGLTTKILHLDYKLAYNQNSHGNSNTTRMEHLISRCEIAFLTK
jgi:hypothetical protein